MELLDHHQVELVSAVVFSLAFVGHLAVSVTDSAIVIGGSEIPIFVSYAAVLVAGFLAYNFWRKILREYDTVGSEATE